MFLNGRYGVLSVVFCIVGILLFYLSTLSMNGIINLYFFLWIASWIASFCFGIKGVKSKENGPVKYFGMVTISEKL
ncbi:hypothetical protein AMD00_11855 [Viridibacillus arvi]|uniref:Uncharacterized protein n=1 Tax=Viridibacillus arvi TaxID=263475 RepID=A0A0M0LDV8_9BACL|nr:hypothetical protein AMD00_11855 [Viridibacillus arvi]